MSDIGREAEDADPEGEGHLFLLWSAVPLTRSNRTRSWAEGALLVMGTLHLNNAFDHRPLFKLFVTTEENPSCP